MHLPSLICLSVWLEYGFASKFFANGTHNTTLAYSQSAAHFSSSRLSLSTTHPSSSLSASDNGRHHGPVGSYVAAGIGITISSTASSSIAVQPGFSTANIHSNSSSTAMPSVVGSVTTNTSASLMASTASRLGRPSALPLGTARSSWNVSGAARGTGFNTGNTYHRPSSGRIPGTGTAYSSYAQGNATLAPTGSGYSYANACNQASVSWTSRWWTASYFIASTWSPTTLTSSPPSSDVYTLCDGIPRMRPNITTQEQQFASWQQIIKPKGRSFPTTSPVCSIQPKDCSSLLLSYSSRHNVPASVSLGPIHTSYEPFILDDFPRCQTNTVGCGQPGADCALSGTGIQLFYWPQTWAGGYCGDRKEIVTMGPTIAGKPNTATWMNYTFTSPTVYVKYDAISAHDTCGSNVGPTLTSGFIALPSESVSSKVPYFMTNIPWEGPSGLMHIGRDVGISNAMLGGWPGLNPDYGDARVPVTYPDLDPATVPAIPYYQREMLGGDVWCEYGGCPTMVPWNYFPRLDVPAQARSLASEWLSCTLAWGAMDDPPSAFPSTNKEATPTISDTVRPTTPATPCITAVPVSETAPVQPHTRSPKHTHHDPSPKVSPAGIKSTQSKNTQTLRDPTRTRGGEHSPAVDPTPNAVTAVSPLTRQPEPGGATTKPNGPGQITDDKHSTANDPAPNVIHTVPLPPTQSVVVGSATLTPTGKSHYVIGTQTLKPGHSAVVVSGTSYSVDRSGHSVYVNGQGTPLPSRSSAVVVAGHTITPGRSAVVISGTRYSVDPSDHSVYVNGSPTIVPADRARGSDLYSQAKVTIGGKVITAVQEPNASGTGAVYVVGSETITAGGEAKTIGGKVVSAGPGGLVVDPPVTEAVFTAGSITFSAVETTDAQGHPETVLLDASTLPDGKVTTETRTLPAGDSVVTTDGETISLGPSGIEIISAGHTRTASFSTVDSQSTVKFSALSPGETMLAINGTPVLFSKTVIQNGSSRLTEYIHGKTTLTPTVVGSGSNRVTEFVGGAVKSSGTKKPVSITAMPTGAPVSAAAVGQPSSTTSSGKALRPIWTFLFLAVSLVALVVWG